MNLMKSKEFFSTLDNIFSTWCPKEIYTPSRTIQYRIYKLYIENEAWADYINEVMLYAKTHSNYRLYWYNIGVKDISLIDVYRKNRNWRVCKICGKIYNKETSVQGKFMAAVTCSIGCHEKSLNGRDINLSLSKLKYNPKDYKQYAIRHNICESEAKAEIENFTKGSSKFCIEYWTKKGYSHNAARIEISSLQKRNSKRCIEYWVAKGYDVDTSKNFVSNYQRASASKRKPLPKESSWLHLEYYISRGKTLEEAKILRESKLRKMSDSLKRTFSVKTKEQIRKDNPRCEEFYLTRGFTKEDATIKISALYSNNHNCVSKISVEFFNEFHKHFSGDTVFRGGIGKEYFVYETTKKKIYFYDYVNITKKFVVEFNGSYWHSPNNKRWSLEYDCYKNSLIGARGFVVFVVWEHDYIKDKIKCVEELYNCIKEWYENRKN